MCDVILALVYETAGAEFCSGRQATQMFIPINWGSSEVCFSSSQRCLERNVELPAQGQPKSGGQK